MNQKTKWIVGIIVVVAVVAVGYFVSKGPSEPVSTEPIKIGVLLPLSGPAAFYGDQSKKGIEIAKEEILEKYPNLKLELYYEDSLYTPKGGVDAYQKLRITTKLDAVITAASQVSLAVVPLTAEDKILQMAIFS
ncbi:MAG: ABC transporter substrate-binding protein, partial [Patescibacteria group bacterium]